MQSSRGKRDKQAFFNEQCQDTEENNRRGKTRGLFKKTEKIKGISHPKMGTIKDRKKDQEEMARIHRRTVQERS